MTNKKTSLVETVKPLFEKAQSINDIEKAVFIASMNNVIDIDTDIGLIQREVKKAQIELGFYLDAEKLKSKITGLKKASKIPFESHEVLIGFVSDFCNKFYSNVKDVTKELKLQLGDKYPTVVVDHFRDETLPNQMVRIIADVYNKDSKATFEDIHTAFKGNLYKIVNEQKSILNDHRVNENYKFIVKVLTLSKQLHKRLEKPELFFK